MRTDNFKHLHTYPDAEAGTLEEKLDEVFEASEKVLTS